MIRFISPEDLRNLQQGKPYKVSRYPLEGGIAFKLREIANLKDKKVKDKEPVKKAWWNIF